MNPHQKNKIDINERKYFDSGDYALSKAGKASDAGVTQIGSQHPLPENIPHLTSPVTASNGMHVGQQTQLQGHHSGSPIKESRFLSRETSAEDGGEEGTKKNGDESSTGSSPVKEGIPVRWQS
ncbi:hypothetical protein FGG08_002072 [Glutinoglossum americanum]|uniref:mRNA stability protein n=1 Tax=Glutinoglossum americanum TaxID=1670608 RepID=A0A9P8I0V1_9PEZI|nr:hypothetical protein FGG08_002072 [Glutinoglossum americanum]